MSRAPETPTHAYINVINIIKVRLPLAASCTTGYEYITQVVSYWLIASINYWRNPISVEAEELFWNPPLLTLELTPNYISWCLNETATQISTEQSRDKSYAEREKGDRFQFMNSIYSRYENKIIIPDAGSTDHDMMQISTPTVGSRYATAHCDGGLYLRDVGVELGIMMTMQV